ncbi:trehalose-phosphatase [Stenotrophomonas sp. YIM B06876]|uniref:trehalose-phosphatase n=1 Tax=Stenotrophomonas sp. YIM B06876 TaxID=3060211 RepID=UPI00273A1FC6|nr:trehalose-phosphatase [Stenotrophomonas sp. YIM B06876]
MATVSTSSPPPLLDADCALFLDVDGTLVEFADHPAEVRLAPAVRDDIERLTDMLHGAVALVSGRPLAQLDALFDPLQLPAAGLHGHQLRNGDLLSANSDQVPERLHALHQRSMQLAHAHPGVLVENKGSALALHWRGAVHSADAVTAFAHAQIQALPGYRLQPGNHVVEFVPAGSDKGSALSALMRQPPFAGRRPVFAGDDLTDESGFAAATHHGGWGVLVGARADTQARYRLADVDAVHAWLLASAR